MSDGGQYRSIHELIMFTSIELHGELDQRFDEIKSHLADKLGYEPTNAEVVGILMAEYSSDTPDAPNDTPVSGLLSD